MYFASFCVGIDNTTTISYRLWLSRTCSHIDLTKRNYSQICRNHWAIMCVPANLLNIHCFSDSVAQVLGASVTVSTPTLFQLYRASRSSTDCTTGTTRTDARSNSRATRAFGPHSHQCTNISRPSAIRLHSNRLTMSRLKSMDNLICFAYSLWCQDYSRKMCIALL